jgi:hypothetical protein
MKKLTPAPIIDRSGLRFDSHPAVQPLRKGHYRVILTTIAGDAPKDFLRIYEYGAGNKASPHNWPAHIAKVGQKWYPNESITEHLLTRIGQFLEIEIADSQLMFVRGQLRFLSRYFLKKRESLVHGAEIFAGYLQDEKFVEEVEKKNQARDIFTFQFVEDALLDRFPEDVDEILQGFVKLLGFDALVGNNDRHFYNWGVITDVAGRTKPRFSPVYDTARALFWNTTDAAIEEIAESRDANRKGSFMSKYVERCYPKTGWDGVDQPNHFDLIKMIVSHRPTLIPTLQSLNNEQLAGNVQSLFEGEFSTLLTEHRKEFIIKCIVERQKRFRESLSLLP